MPASGTTRPSAPCSATWSSPWSAEQAETYGHSFAHEVSYLTVHSVLHLLGYDHVDEGEDKRRMRAREKEIMRLLDV